MDIPIPGNRNQLATRPAETVSLPHVSASVLGADLANLERDTAEILTAGAGSLHLDVMDGRFVPNLTMGPGVCKSLRRALPNATLDVHLMTDDPERWLETFAKAGADHCTLHAEAVPPADRHRLFAVARRFGMTIGIAISPGTPASEITGDLDHVDLALVMSVNPGFAGQAFMPEVLGKASEIRDAGFAGWVQIDGGVGPANAKECVAAGVNNIVAATSLFSGRGTAGDRVRALAKPA